MSGQYPTEAKNMKDISKLLPRRIVLAVLGVFLNGVSIGFFKSALFGVDPFQCLCNGLANRIPIRFGTLYMLINLVLLCIVFFMDRHYIGISTFLNLFLMGYIVEFSEALLKNAVLEPGLALRIGFLAIGVVITCIAAALYYTARLGVSTYDAIPLHISDRRPKLIGRVLPFKLVRIIADLICTMTGVLLGATAGVGTVITALFMGPLISFFRRTLSEPLLFGRGTDMT